MRQCAPEAAAAANAAASSDDEVGVAAADEPEEAESSLDESAAAEAAAAAAERRASGSAASSSSGSRGGARGVAPGVDEFTAAWVAQQGQEGLLGALVALSYPDRIAQRKDGGSSKGTYQLSAGG